MRLSIFIPVKLVSIVNGQLSCLLLRHVMSLILIDFDLPMDLFKSARVHLCACHELAYPTLELKLLDFFRWHIFILLLDLGLKISGQPLHISQNIYLLWSLLQQLLRISILIVIHGLSRLSCMTDIKWRHVDVVRSAHSLHCRNLLCAYLFLIANIWSLTLQILLLSILLGQRGPGSLDCNGACVGIIVERVLRQQALVDVYALPLATVKSLREV